jgi:Recombination endonuclease VII
MADRNLRWARELVTMANAKRQGDTRYFTGKPCRSGHIAERLVSNRSCSVCLQDKLNRRRTPEAKRIALDQLKRRIARDPTLRDHINKLQRDNHARRAKRKHKLRVQMAGRQRPDNCEACGNPHSERNRVVYDHCHKSGQFRGWLCDRCNKVLGLMSDDGAALKMLADYVEKFDVKVDHEGPEQPTSRQICRT